MVEISASILSLEKENAIKTFYNLETAKIDYFHIDVMDGEFVNNNTEEKMLEFCDYLSNITNLPLDVHLMVKDVKKYIDMFLPYNPNIITFHIEAVKDKNELIDLIDYIHHNNCKAGISIKPETPVEKLYDILEIVNLVLVMTVEPGEGGQELIPETISKIEQLSEKIKELNLDTIIETDGGINITNSEELKKAGAEILVVGTGLLKSDDYAGTVRTIKK